MGQIPISCLLTSASLHDSQAAIPLATLSAERTTNLYDLMRRRLEANAEQIREHRAAGLGPRPTLIDVRTPVWRQGVGQKNCDTEARRLKNLGFQLPSRSRYNKKTYERVSASMAV